MTHYDVLVVGTGPAGLHAAVEASRSGASVAVIEKARDIGGACVHRGTIPSKTLRETAVQLSRLKRSSVATVHDLDEQTEVAALMHRLETVVAGHVRQMSTQIENSGAHPIAGRARFLDERSMLVERVRGEPLVVTADKIILAVGSRPRRPDNVPIDHENVLDSDSILSMIYLPKSLCVLGAGVIACEWASIFTELGVKVTMIDSGSRPLAFMDPDLSAGFVRAFTAAGSRYLPNRKVADVRFDGVSEVIVTLDDGDVVGARKLLCAYGRVANLDSLDAERIGLTTTKRGHLAVDEHFRSSVEHIYGVGDVVGFPALAATSAEQGREAARHALGLPSGAASSRIPVGIFTIPELSSVGLTEEQARERHGRVLVGKARFDEIARGHISGVEDGLVKLVADPETLSLVGAHILGAGATELIGIAQMAMAADMKVNALVENIFNFPTLAEAYRVAALDMLHQHEQQSCSAAE